MNVRVVSPYALEECIVVIAFEREIACQHYVEYNPQGPHVVFSGIGILNQNFGRLLVLCASDTLGIPVRLDSKPKVNYFYWVNHFGPIYLFGFDENVFKGDVFVHYFAFVDAGHSFYNFLKPSSGNFFIDIAMVL